MVERQADPSPGLRGMCGKHQQPRGCDAHPPVTPTKVTDEGRVYTQFGQALQRPKVDAGVGLLVLCASLTPSLTAMIKTRVNSVAVPPW